MSDPKDSKALVSAIMAKRGEDPDAEKEGGESEDNAGLETAAEDMISAVNSGDAKALVEALKSFVDMCAE